MVQAINFKNKFKKYEFFNFIFLLQNNFLTIHKKKKTKYRKIVIFYCFIFILKVLYVTRFITIFKKFIYYNVPQSYCKNWKRLEKRGDKSKINLEIEGKPKLKFGRDEERVISRMRDMEIELKITDRIIRK